MNRRIGDHVNMEPSASALPRPERPPAPTGPLPPPAAAPHASRLAWLDALRGVAALVVVFDHASYSYLAKFRQELMPEFNTSRYGIMVFFLVSGYIIPASLERRGCVRTFWVGRLFRIYPLWAVVVTALPAADLAGVAQVRDFGGQSAVSATVAHVTLLQELLATPNLLLVLWTISYSVYLVHPVLLAVNDGTFGRWQRDTPALTAAFYAVLLPVSALTYRYVEAPGQAWGRKLVGRMRPPG
ncbi:acyltransferase family protein [Streptomyces sp. NPDC018955]|uniref:acyltransferase family protein n=1 Tax=Streptomyces sp. NPDC018955 TaxID=3365055 RepID=UPI0037AAD535